MTVLAGCAAPPASERTPAGAIEVVISGFAYHANVGTVEAGKSTTLVIINRDLVTHGFQWALEPLDVEVTGGDLATLGAGLKGLHIAPRGRAEIRFTLAAHAKLAFRCDLHPDMTGELFILDVWP
jgi:hypothetical protein